jgi:hypothetical protein
MPRLRAGDRAEDVAIFRLDRWIAQGFCIASSAHSVGRHARR